MTGLQSWRNTSLLSAVLARRTDLYASLRSSRTPRTASQLVGLGLVLVFSLLVAVRQDTTASALSLKMQPLIYKDTLAQGEKKKGFVDISNPSSSKVRLKTSIQSFRQTDDQGSLQFYDDKQVAAGITPDVDEFELGPREAIRMYFLIDGTKLPSGDVFAALFVTVVPGQEIGATSSVRLGTLFSLTNGTPGERHGEITDLQVPFWQFGDKVQGSYRIKNVAKAGESTGFFPTVTIAIKPFDQQVKQEGKLIFAGRERENMFQIPANRIGFYKVSAAYGDSRQSKLVFMATGYWAGILIGAALLILVAVAWLITRAVKRRRVSK